MKTTKKINQIKLNLIKRKLGKKIVQTVLNVGGEIYLVGGAVRDLFMNKQNKDLDFTVIGLNKESFEYHFSESDRVGKSFPVYLVNGHEVSLGRKERSVGDGYKDFEWLLADTIEDDLKRRDLTMNAIAIDLCDGKIIDPFNGLNDIKNKIIKHVSDKFDEDPLRVYRTARFLAQTSFKIKPTTIEKINKLKDKLNSLPVERVFMELRKAINSDHPHLFFDGLLIANVLHVHFPEIKQMEFVEEPINHHPEEYTYNHTMLTLQTAKQITDNELVLWSALVHDIGKIKTLKEKYPHHYNHSKLGIEPYNRLCERLKVPNDWYKAGLLAIEEHMRMKHWKEMSPGKLVRLYEKANKNPLGIEGLTLLGIADNHNRISDYSGFVELGNRIFKEVNGKTVDFKNKVGKQRGQLLFNERSHWIKRERGNY